MNSLLTVTVLEIADKYPKKGLNQLRVFRLKDLETGPVGPPIRSPAILGFSTIGRVA